VSIFNSIIMGWPTGWNLDASTGAPTDLNYSAATPKAFVSNTILAGNNTQLTYNASAGTPTGWTTADLTNYFNRISGGNTILANASDAGLTAPFKYDSSVDFNPAAGSPALTGGSFTATKISDTFFTTVTFRGAAGAGDTWWKTWTSFK
jgi:hypothetical protein